jgi:cytoskeletal protein CcmA (bactofilin family)
MALWKEPLPAPTPQASPPPVTDLRPRIPEKEVADLSTTDSARRVKERVEPKESVLAAELTIEGKIQSSGSVRIAGRFKGDVHVKGSVNIEAGAHLEGEVHATTIVVGGELTGNVQNAKHVDVLPTGVIIGDVKAGSLTVAAGSRMRGHVEFGWEEGQAAHGLTTGTGLASKL